MMTKDEALRLALEALENHCGNYKLDDAGCERWNKAVAAIKEALAPTSTQCEVQPEQEPGLICHKHDEPKRGCAWCDKHPPKAQPQQEPVALIEHDDETAEPCPSCGKPLQSASGGGVVCSERCGYWFCF